MKYTITAPVKDYTGTGWGLIFAGGSAETTSVALARKLRKRGYTVKEQKPPKADPPADTDETTGTAEPAGKA
ncbi:MAG: hypothetical protein ACI4O7_08160 [Aristaeellaceae bacterium]